MRKPCPASSVAQQGTANRRKRLGLLAASLLMAHITHAQTPGTSPAAIAAWEVLSKTSTRTAAPASASSVAAPSPASMGAGQAGASLVVQKGQTLDIIIRTHLPRVPYKTDLVRRAIMDLNPGAFPIGSPHLMRAGTALRIPTPEQLRQLAVQRDPALGPYLGTATDEPESKKTGNQDRSKWVRFP